MKEQGYKPESFERLCKVMADTLKIPAGDITPEMRQEDVETWDSFQHLTLIMEVEAAFGVTLQTEDIPEMRDVEGIACILRMRGADI